MNKIENIIIQEILQLKIGQLKHSPKSAKDRLYINTDLDILQYKITDVSGKHIESGMVKSKSEIQIKTHTSGIYFF